MRVRSVTLAAISALALGVAAPATLAQAASPEEPTAGEQKVSDAEAEAKVEQASEPTGQVIVTYNDSSDREAPATELDADGAEATVERNLDNDSVVVSLEGVTSPDEVNQIMDELAKDPNVVSVQPDLLIKPFTNDPYWDQLWGLHAPTSDTPAGIDVEGAWELTTGASDVYVAVVDSGIINHPDLNGRWVGGYDFVSNSAIGNDGNGRDSDPRDPGNWISQADRNTNDFANCPTGSSTWHGSHVAGTIGAKTNDGYGIAGINQVSKIVPVRALGKCGGYISDVADAVRWSAGLPVTGAPNNPYKADVINLSIGTGAQCDDPTVQPLRDAINAAVANNVAVVTSAGNDNGNATYVTPGNCNGVINVAATSRTGNKASYSSYGSVVDLAAPGGDSSTASQQGGIVSTVDIGSQGPQGPGWSSYVGTSMAAPHVAGVVSLMRSVNPNLSPTEVLKILQTTARPFPQGSNCSSRCGVGMLDAAAAVEASQPEASVENLALDGAATQSSTYGGQVASRANDGNTSGIKKDSSSSHTQRETQPHWDLSLDASSTIDNIVVWARTDCCAGRINDFWVFASDQPFTSNDPNVLANNPNVNATRVQSPPRPNTTINLDNYKARYVRVQLNGTNFLQLAEVQVFGERTEAPRPKLDNLALTGTATQTSTYSGQVASRANDGNTSGIKKDSSSSHTQRETQPHWDLSLDASSTIDNIVVWARTDCCAGRINDFWVFASDQPFTSNDPNVLANNPNVNATRVQSPPRPNTTINLDNYKARYVRVQLNGTNFLQLAEVQVFGERTEAPRPKLDNLALTGTATQTSTYGGQVASRANDGNTSGIKKDSSSSHTQRETQPHWDLSLDASSTIDNIVVWARTDCCAGRINDFWVFASDQPFTSNDPNVLANNPNVNATRVQSPPRPNTTINLDNYKARYVRVQLNGTNFLQLAEVQVFGKE